MSKTEPILDLAYWREKMYDAVARGELHRIQFAGTVDEMAAIERRQKQALVGAVADTDSVLDLGCGYGRLLSLLPKTWKGDYLGVDQSPDMLAVATRIWPTHAFAEMDIRDYLLQCTRTYDVVVCIWLKTMLERNGLGRMWEDIVTKLPSVAEKIVIID